jgi:hypothetical protein
MASLVSVRMGDGGNRGWSALAGIFLVLGLTSCTPLREFDFQRHNHRPKPRMGRNASATILTRFSGRNLGKHSYHLGGTEENGIVYTCRAGHLDMAHVRKAMDWTAYLASKTYKAILQRQTQFSFLGNEPARYYVKLTYPADWDMLLYHEREPIARNVGIELGAYLTYTSTTLHEIFSWYDFSISIVFSEFSSAFSWEDNTSNLLGCMIGSKALRQGLDFNESATRVLRKELNRLQIQPMSVAKKASKKMEGQWYTGKLFLGDLIQRHFDIGTDGFVESCTVDIPECKGSVPELFPVPTLASVLNQGVLVELEIKPYFAKDKILTAAYPDDSKRKKRITPAHFQPIIQSIIKDAEERGYAFVQ